MNKTKKILVGFISLLAIGIIIAQKFKIQETGADINVYNPKSFGYYPWGKSITHKGDDIFEKKAQKENRLTFTTKLQLFSLIPI